MDPELWRIAQALPSGESVDERAARLRSARKLQASRARDVRRKKRERANQAPISTEELAVLSFSVPACQDFAKRLKAVTRGAVKVEALQRLAYSRRIQGSGAAVERVRHLQSLGVRLMGQFAQHRQQAGLQKWLAKGRPSPGSVGNLATHRFRGVSVMWDEAPQRSRAMLLRAMRSRSITKSQNVVEFLVAIGAVFEMALTVSPPEVESDHREGCVVSWQPWLMAPLLVEPSSTKFVLQALAKSLPLDFRREQSLADWGSGVEACVVCLLFDSAASNLEAIGQLSKLVKDSETKNVLLHGQRCLTHQINICRTDCATLSGCASMLYSLSKLVGNSSSITGLHRAFEKHVSKRLVIRFGDPPS